MGESMLRISEMCSDDTIERILLAGSGDGTERRATTQVLSM
jgi:hypothetical protein